MKNKIKIIDLLNKIANGEELPKKIKYCSCIYKLNRIKTQNGYDIDYYCDYCNEMLFADVLNVHRSLNIEIEILDEEKPTQEEIKEYTNKFLEAWTPVKKQFGKLFDEIARLEDELDEDKDIPLIPDDELFTTEENILTIQEIDYNFRVLKEKINQVVEELNKRQ